MAAAPGPGRKPKEDLQKLIADIGEWLKGGDGTSLDGGSSGGGGGGGNEPHVIERFRLVLPRVLDTVLDPTRVRRVAGKELKPVLGIVTAVIQKHPEVLNHGSGDLPRHLFARMFTLLTLSISSEAVDAVLDTLQAVTTLVGAARREHFCCVFAGAVELCEDLGAALPLLLSSAGSAGAQPAGVTTLAAFRHLFPHPPPGEQPPPGAPDATPGHLVPVGPSPPCGGVSLPITSLGTWALLSVAACSLASSSGAATWQQHAASGLWTPQAAVSLSVFIQIGGPRLQRAACRCIRSAAVSLGRAYLPRTLLVSAIRVALLDRCAAAATTTGLAFVPGGTVDDALGAALQECVPGIGSSSADSAKGDGGDDSPRFSAGPFSVDEWQACLAPFAAALAPLIIRDAASTMLRSSVHAAALTALRGCHGADVAAADGGLATDALLARTAARACLDALRGATTPVAPDRRAALAEVLSAALLRAGSFRPVASAVGQPAAKAPAVAVDDAADPPPSTKRRRLRRAAAADGEGGNGDGVVPMAVDAAAAPPSHASTDIHAHVLATLLRLSPPQQQELAGEAVVLPSPADVLTSLSSLSVLCTALAAAPRDCAVVQAAAACVSSWCAWACADGPRLPPMAVRSAVLDAVLCLLCGAPGGTAVPAAGGVAATRPPPLEQLVVPQQLLRVVAWAPPKPTAAPETSDDVNEAASACGSRALACALALHNRDTLLVVMRMCVTHATLPPLRAAAAAAAPCAVAQGLLSMPEALAGLAPLAGDTHAGVCITLAQCLGGLASASAALADGGSIAADVQAFAWRSGPGLVVVAAACGGHLPKHSFGALDACVAALPPSTGQGALPLTGPGWRPFLERFWCSADQSGAPQASAARPPCEEALAASVTSSSAILRHASPAHMAGAATLLTSLAAMAGHPGRTVRLAACFSAHVLALPAVIAACYPTVKAADERELQLLGTYRSLFQPTAPAQPSQLTQGGDGDMQPRQGGAHQSDARDTGLRTFASVGIALDSRSSDAVTLFCCVAALDDPNWAVRSAALAAVRALASARRAPSLKVFILAHKKVLAFVGEHLGRRPRLTAQLAGAMGMVPTRLVATELLPAALPAIVASCDESALVAAASALGRTPGELLADNVQFVIADLIERNVLYGQAHGAHTYTTTAFVQRVTGRSMTDLVAATREELIEVLLENVGADPDISTADAGAKLRTVVHTLMVSFGQGGDGSGGSGNPPDLGAFMQSHITGLLKHTGDALVAASEVGGGVAPSEDAPAMGAALDLGAPAPPLTSSAAAAMQPAAAALRSLRVLVALMEASVPQFAPKVLCLLSRVATSCGPHLRVHALHAAQDLARCMNEHAPKHLPLFAGPLLVLCLPWLTAAPGAAHGASHDAAVDLVTLLVLGTGTALKGHLGSLPTLPAVPALKLVIAAIQAERGTLALHQRLDALAQGLRHESLAVRAIAAAEATREVRLCPPGAVADAFATHPTEANGFLAALLSCCTGDGRASAAQRAAHAAALSCLGELGALDPARVSLLPTPPPRAFVPSDTVFGASLIENHVARLMRGAADPHTLDVAAYVCQEVLRHFRDAKPAAAPSGGPPGAPATRGGGAGGAAGGAGRRSSASAAPGAAQQPQQASDFDALWQMLRPETQELIAPCLNSKYFVTSQGVVAPAPGSAPLFSLRPELAYRRWLQLWCRGLIAFGASSPRAGLFKAVTSILRFDIGTMLVLLPHLVLAAVCHGGPGARAQVAAEIVAVLSEAAGVADMPTSGGDSVSLGAGVLPPAATGRSALAAQTVFTLLDQLAAWLADSRAARSMAKLQAAATAPAKKPSAPLGGALAAAAGAGNGTQAGGGRSGGDADETAIADFLKDIPKVLCAQAAASVGAAARALQYYEDHLRRRNKNLGLNNPASYHGATPANVPTSEAEVSFLGALYRQLEQPDALAALPKLRSVPSVADRVAQAEQSGDFAEALAFFEAAMHQEAASPGHGTSLTDAEQGRLRCLWGLGQLGAVLRETAALLPARTDSSDELCAAGAAAAWRLGHWDALHTYCSAAGVDQEGVHAAATGSIMAGGSAFGGPSEGSGALTLAAAMRAVHARDSVSLEAAVRAGQEAALAPLAAAAMEGSYERAHPHLLRLHALHEVVAAADVLLTPGRSNGSGITADAVQVGTFCSLMDSRLGAVQPTLGAREPLLALRGAVLSLVCAVPGADGVAAARQGARRAALATAKLCRASGAHGAAQLAVLRAQGYGDDAVSRLEAAVEGARLLWDTGRGHRAVSDLQEALSAAIGLGPLPPGATQRLSTGGTAPLHSLTPGRAAVKPSVQARATLLLARWAHETGQKQKSEVLELYGRITAAEPRWEAAYFYMAKYTDELLTDAKRRERVGIAPQAVNTAAQRALRAAAGAAGGGAGAQADVPERHTDYLVLTVRNYGLALRHGCKRIFQALPRMLTLWFDAPSLLEPPLGGAQSSAAAAAAWSPERKRRDKAIGEELKRTMGTLLSDPGGKLPRTVWLTALPVLISRICHKDADTAQCVRSLLGDLTASSPAHVLWSLAMISKSREQARRTAAAEVLTAAKKGCPDKALFAAFAVLVDNLVKLCNYQPKDANAKTFSLASELVALKRCMPVPVVVPVQRYLTASLPADGGVCDDGRHSPFDKGAPTLVEVLDEVDVMHSLQKPKKVTFRGSDGALVSFLAKPKDDLRKDLRMMEFVSLLNRTLAREPASRKRRLYLRSFAVLPLTEDCGLIEWVPHTTGLRIVLQDQYARANLFDRRTSTAEAKNIYEQGERQGRPPAETLRQVLRKYPPIFHRYFPERFADPAAWFAARSGFAHTAAVWSMVGHIVGLGDRHGENILVDTSNGDVVHVDFSCLFDKGLELDKPEVVPFRLTQNMIDALGVAGPDGVFSSVCEITLGVLRQHRDALMSVLDTFVHDPLLEWTRAAAKQQQQQGGGGAAHVAVALAAGGEDLAKSLELLTRIRSRLEGVVVGVGAAPSLPLSTAGQARRLIEEAVNLDNLGRMYIWWMAWW